MIHEIKADLKVRAAALRAAKTNCKIAQREGKVSTQSEVSALQWDYRHRHVAYCMTRGRERSMIERNPRRPLDEALLKGYLDGYRLHLAIQRGELKKGPPEFRKLYVVVDDTLPRGYASIQAAHAVAEYMKLKKDFPNGTLVVLRASPAHVAQLGYHPAWVRFHEPDLENRLTAVSGYQEKNHLVQGLSLL